MCRGEGGGLHTCSTGGVGLGSRRSGELLFLRPAEVCLQRLTFFREVPVTITLRSCSTVDRCLTSGLFRMSELVLGSGPPIFFLFVCLFVKSWWSDC